MGLIFICFVLLDQLLNAGYVYCVWSFRRISFFKRHFVSCFQFFVAYSFKLIPVKKQIFFFSINGDESESFICKIFNCSFHDYKVNLINV